MFKKKYLLYFAVLLCFPISFLIHGINENFGLIETGEIISLFLLYLVIGLIIPLISLAAVREINKAILFSFFLFLTYFLFGLLKDFAGEISGLKKLTRYSIFLPILFLLLLLLCVYLRRSSSGFTRGAGFIRWFLVINLVAECSWCIFNFFSHRERKQDFGDNRHELIRNFDPSAVQRKPAVFWLVFDEYASSGTLKKVWNFTNPLDTFLTNKKFFLADSAQSNYNFTHYALSSTLDMVYLPELKNHSIVTLRDLARGGYSIYENNTVELFSRAGYTVNNFSIFQLKGHPTRATEVFNYVPRSLINYQTLGGRAQKEIGWNFTNLFRKEKHSADSILFSAGFLQQTDMQYKKLIQDGLQAIRNGADKKDPQLFLFHFMLPHEPYMYKADGSINYAHGYSEKPEDYLPHLEYTNSVIEQITDSILAAFAQKDIVVIIQGDHGYKFQESDPLYETESCRPFYAVYCSDQNYRGWYRSLSTVNSFRILFNKYFHTEFNLLPDSAFNLYYRINK